MATGWVPRGLAATPLHGSFVHKYARTREADPRVSGPLRAGARARDTPSTHGYQRVAKNWGAPKTTVRGIPTYQKRNAWAGCWKRIG